MSNPSFTGAGNPDPYGAAKEINLNNTLLANPTYPNGGQGMTVSLSVFPSFKGSFDLVQVNIADPDGRVKLPSPSSDVLVGINLEPMTTVTSTSLVLYNSCEPRQAGRHQRHRADRTTPLACPPDQHRVQCRLRFFGFRDSQQYRHLVDGRQMNSATGAVAAIPTITTPGGTATVYANLLNPMQTGCRPR